MFLEVSMRDQAGPFLVEQIRKLEEENKALREDAERYRWLRNTDTRDYAAIFEDKSICMKFGTHLDAAIDAARGKK
jgi:hypothetical protein